MSGTHAQAGFGDGAHPGVRFESRNGRTARGEESGRDARSGADVEHVQTSRFAQAGKDGVDCGCRIRRPVTRIIAGARVEARRIGAGVEAHPATASMTAKQRSTSSRVL